MLKYCMRIMKYYFKLLGINDVILNYCWKLTSEDDIKYVLVGCFWENYF